MMPQPLESTSVDICAFALLKDLAALDAGIEDPQARLAVVRSAIESIEILEKNEGGPLGADRVAAIGTALRAEEGKLSC